MTPAAKEKPLVSVILAACNEAAFIEDTVKSLLSQSTDSFDLELLVIDNGSLDNTRCDCFAPCRERLTTHTSSQQLEEHPRRIQCRASRCSRGVRGHFGRTRTLSARLRCGVSHRTGAPQRSGLQRKDPYRSRQ